MEIQNSKEVWVAWTNTDCTEGRGRQIPKAVCDLKATAIRLGRKGSVQGSDCQVSKSIAVMVNNCWLIPGVIHAQTPEDVKAQNHMDKKQAAMEKAKAAGLTDEDLKLLM